MSSTTILWHPTVARLMAVPQPADDLEVFLILPDPLDLRMIDEMGLSGLRISLLVNGRDFRTWGYGLLRRLQRHRWTLALCYSTDDLATDSRDALEQAIEVAKKFRIDVDFFLTLPSEGLQATDGAQIFQFLARTSVRRVSFAYSLLLSKIGLKPGNPKRRSEFFDAFFGAWLASNRALIIDDLHRLSSKLESAKNGVPEPIDVMFVDAQSTYRNVDGPVPELRDMPEASGCRGYRCARFCEYYLVCGGDMYGAKALFNGTLDSADNPYCALVAKPLFARALAGALR